MNGTSDTPSYGKWCNYCERPGHFYTDCALDKFDQLVALVAKKLDEGSKQVGYSNIPYPGDSAYDHMHQNKEHKYKFPESDVHWGSFWSTEPRDDSADLRGPDNWYDDGGHGDS